MVGILTSLLPWTLYFLPTVVARERGHHRRAAISAVNPYLGWTGIGWLVALWWALAPNRQGGRLIGH